MTEKCDISEIQDSASDGINSVLLNFQNGNLSNIDKDNTLFFQARDSETKGNKAIVVAGGNVYQGEVDQQNPTANYIAIRNKTSNKVRLIPIDSSLLTNNIYCAKEKEVFERIEKTESYNKLLRNFGGRKATRYLDRVEKMKIDVNVVKDQLDKTVEEVDISINSETVSTEDSLDKIRPKFAADAKKLDDVYNLCDVIPKDLLERLEMEANAVVNADVADLPIESEFLKLKITAVQNSPDPTSISNIQIIKAIIYMDALTALIKTRAKNLAKVELSGIAEKVENHIKKNFCYMEYNKIMRTSSSSEKALCYFIVLALLISDNYEVDITKLIEHLSTPRPKIVKYAHLCNAKVRVKTDVLCLCLPSNIAPLKIPYAKRRGGA